MVKFNEDNDLGKVVQKTQLFSFGAAPIKQFKEIVFAAGGNKFSTLCGFRFESKAPTQYKTFFIAFICKLRSKIYRTATANPSQWFILKKISGKEMHCLSKRDLLLQYGFDITKFFDSDLFQQSLAKFKKCVDNGLNKHIPAFVEQHGLDKADGILTHTDGDTKQTLVKDAVQKYADAISSGIENIDYPLCNDKFYKLIDYGIKVEDEEEKKVNEVDVRSLSKRSMSPDDLMKKISDMKKNSQGSEFNKVIVTDKNQNKMYYAIDTYELPYNGGLGIICDFSKDSRYSESDDVEDEEQKKETEEQLAEKELDDKIEEALKEIYN